MRILRWSELKAVPWKNGGGITREIAIEHGVERFHWRLSVADVDSDGPFSRFDGLRRILTVVDGKGMELVGSNGTLQADIGRPVAFAGGLDITSRLKDGPVRDFNVIFDPLVCTGDVSVLAGEGAHTLRCGEQQIVALHCTAGTVFLGGAEQLQRGDTALMESGSCNIRLDAASRALVVTIERHS